MWDVFGAIKAASDVAGKVMDRLWGGRTREQDRLEKEMVDAWEQKRQALARGDVAAANQHDARARRLRDEIAAKYSS